MTTETCLAITWSTSRARDTDGYRVCRLDDLTTGKRFKCMGGGYDMAGTVFGEWLQETYQDRLKAIYKRAYRVWNGAYLQSERVGDLYGMTVRASMAYGRADIVNRVVLEGACGLEAMVRIAKAAGLEVTRTYSQRGITTGFMVVDPEGQA